MESKIYKRRLIILVVFFVISLLAAFWVKNVLFNYVGELKGIKTDLESVTGDDEKALLDKYNNGSERYKTKEDLIKIIDANLEYFSFVDDYTQAQMLISSTYSIFSLFNGIMICFVFFTFIIKKFIPDLKKWMVVILEIAAFILIIPGFQIIAMIGLFVTIPNVIYNVYKYVKLRKKQTIEKDDVIKEN